MPKQTEQVDEAEQSAAREGYQRAAMRPKQSVNATG